MADDDTTEPLPLDPDGEEAQTDPADDLGPADDDGPGADHPDLPFQDDAS